MTATGWGADLGGRTSGLGTAEEKVSSSSIVTGSPISPDGVLPSYAWPMAALEATDGI